MTDVARDRTPGQRLDIDTNPGSGRRSPQVTGQTQAVAEAMQADPVSMIGKFLSWARIAWIAAVFLAGGIGTGVGMLIGEGRAREAFEYRLTASESGIGSVKEDIAIERKARLEAADKERLARDASAAEERRERKELIDKVNALERGVGNIQGSLDTIRDMLRQQRGGR